MSGIVLSASVRQNLLSLQSTADLLATTQNRLSTGKKVNTALDHPTNYFTARSLDARAGDIANLLDGISNGVQVLQQANNGITSLQKLVDTAKSIAVQALQTTVGYSTKSNVSATIPGATALDLRGSTSFSSATATSNTLYSGAAGGTTAAAGGSTLGGTIGVLAGTAQTDLNGANVTGTTLLFGASGSTALVTAGTTFLDGDVLTVNGKNITLRAASTPAVADVPAGSGLSGRVLTNGDGNATVYLNAATTVGDLMAAIDLASGVRSVTSIASGVANLNANNAGQTASSIAGGAISLRSSTGADLSVSGKADLIEALGLTTATGAGTATVTAARTTGTGSLSSLIQDGTQLYVNGKVISFKNAPTPAAATVPAGSGVSGNVVNDGAGNATVYLQQATINDILQAIDLASGVRTATNASGAATVATASGQTNSSIDGTGTLRLSTGPLSDLAITGSGNAMAALGLTGNTGTATAFVAARATTPGSLSGKTLTFSSFNGGTPVNITFGDGTNGTIKTLNELNAVLQANNMLATVDSTGKLTIAAGNDYASSTLGSALSGGVIGGTALSVLSFTVPVPPVIDAQAQSTRANLVNEYNNTLNQITTTAQDASFNGVNLLDGDQLKLVFNETGKSVLSITGVSFSASGLGLAALTVGLDFIDNAATNRTLTSLRSATSLLQSQASALGSNLSIVQIRQDFSKNLINTLQTGSSNLTLADTNEEAANSQALATRQSIAVSALGLANQAQQSVLQLLRG